MNTIKRLLSAYEYIPFKMAVIYYILKWIYFSFNHYEFDYSYSLLEIIGFYIIYTIVRVIAQLISYNDKHKFKEVYFLNNEINKKVKNLLKKFTYHEDQLGVYEVKWLKVASGDFEEVEVPLKNPLELHYILQTYSSLLLTIGSYTSDELIEDIRKLSNKVDEMLEGVDLNSQRYLYRD